MGANATTFVPAYVAGEVLTAADLNITNSGIPVFASTVERDAAFGGTGEKTLAEGQFAYLETGNVTQYYDGAAWQSVGATTVFGSLNTATAQNTTSATYVSLTTADTVTLTTGTKATVIFSGIAYASSGVAIRSSCEVSGATTIAADDARAQLADSVSNGAAIPFTYVFRFTTLTAGSNTFTQKYRSNGSSTINFFNRTIVVIGE